MNIQRVALGFFLSTSILPLAELHAQSPGPTSSGELVEIIVTATKRSESAQTIAAPVVALDTADFAERGVKDVQDISKVLPDVRVDTIIGGTNISIRGIRTSSVSPTTDSPASLNVDGIYLANTGGLTGLLYDLQRVEELPGPQGTLYGRNATSGVINFITNQPSDVYGGSFEAEGGSYSLERLDGAVNMPLNDKIAFRVAGHFYRRNGYFSNGMDDADQDGGRVSARIELTDSLKLLLSTDYEKSQDNGFGSAVVGSTYGSPPHGFGPPPAPAGAYPVPSNPFRNTETLYPLGIGPQTDYSELHGAMANLQQDFGWALLNIQYGRRSVYTLANTTNLGNYDPANPVGIGALPTTIGYTEAPSHSLTQSGELRLASYNSPTIEWIGGLYYFHEQATSTFCQQTSLTVSVINAANCAQLFISTPSQTTDSYAGFGNATYSPPFLTALHVDLGARYTEDIKSGTALTNINPVPTVISDKHFDKFTYKANVSYDVAAKNLVYAQYSTGFRAGGIAYGSMPVYQPETIEAIEIGSKNRFLQDRLQINLAAFSYHYKDVLTNITKLGPLPPPVFFGLTDLTVTNIGAIDYHGGSIVTAFAITPDDRLDLDLQFVTGKYKTFVIPAGYIATAPLDMTGKPIAGNSGYDLSGLGVTNIAPWSGTLSYDHAFHLPTGQLHALLASQFSGTSHTAPGAAQPSFPGSIQYAAGTVSSYARFDASFTYSPDKSPWHVTAYVTNLTNKVTDANSTYEGQNNTSSGLIIANLLPPRTFGVIAGTKF